ncbi:hypothetical protein [Halobacillus litoralis]|uniref:hypothetical protein n=1 Tax=Halobacillus litoralis TaxID=45668 RepID=UPI002491ADEB|nr:hypothetical protein [Halobacillus litoralis]
MNHKVRENVSPERDNTIFWFPGRWIGGLSLIIGPLLLLAAALLRIQFHFFYDAQLAAYAHHPVLITAAYSCFVLGCLFLWPGVITLVRFIGRKHPALAVWGGMFTILGLIGRVFHGGIDHMAFQLVNVQSLNLATKAVSDSYQAFHIVRYLNGWMMVGWILLAIGAYRSRTFGLIRSVALASMFFLPLGTLKGTRFESTFLILGLCIALIPLGIKVLRDGPPPSRKAIYWAIAFVAGEIIFILLSILFPEIMRH